MSDRAERLSSRRKERSSEQSAEQDQQAEEEQSGQSEQSEQPAEQAEPDQQEESQSIKDQYQGKYMYLPEALGDEFDLVAKELDTQRQRRNGKEVEKIRHFEPLIVKKGLEAVTDADADELEEWLSEFDP